MELSIWSPDFVAVHKWFFGIFAVGTVSLVLLARSFEPYKVLHMLCGVALMMLGVGSLAFVIVNTDLVNTLVNAKMMGDEARDDANLIASILQITMPAIAFSLGTRFIGNWVTMRPPDSDSSKN